MSKYQDQSGRIIEVGNPSLNPDLIKGMTQVADSTAVTVAPSGSLVASNMQDQPSIVLPTTPISTAPNKALDLSTNVADILNSITETNNTNLKETTGNLNKANATGTSILQGFIDKILNRPSKAQITSEAFQTSGVNAIQTQITDLAPKIADAQTRLNNLKTEEATAIESLTGQGRGIPTAILEGQAAKVQRQYAIRENAVAAELSAYSANYEALNNNLSKATQLASIAVEAKVYDFEQTVQDYKDLYTLNKDVIDRLDTKQKDLLDREYKNAQDVLAQKRKEATDVMQLMIDNPNANVQISDTLEQAVTKVKKAGGSLAARQEARLNNPSGDGTNQDAVSVYGKLIHDAIDQGIDPNTAVVNAETNGIKLTLAQKNALVKDGQTYQTAKKNTPAATPNSTKTPIEVRRDELLKFLTPGQVRQQLTKEFPATEVGATMLGVGNVLDQFTNAISSYIFGE